jgi:hypothetical protein
MTFNQQRILIGLLMYAALTAGLALVARLTVATLLG